MRPNSIEAARLAEDDSGTVHWKAWGPYLSERQWGTVREDYSRDGSAWDYFPHDHARSRAYRWGEDGLAGFSDHHQRLCLGLALWNGRDPILKERLFGLTNSQGNHGEDVKEIYYYLDATPTHSYLAMLYKYPQAEFPYQWLVDENGRRGAGVPEFDLLDTGLLNDDRYFDVTVEYAKADPHDFLMRITVENRGPDDAEIHVLPHIWFRNTWSWGREPARPVLQTVTPTTVQASHPILGTYFMRFGDAPTVLVTDNETNSPKLFGASAPGQYFKDAFHERVIHENLAAVNPEGRGTKAAAWYRATVPAGRSLTFRARLSKNTSVGSFADFDTLVDRRRNEADEYYAKLQTGIDNVDERRIQRQAFAGMIWSKQFYHIDIPQWLEGDPAQPPPPRERLHGRNHDWVHLNNADIISMPDKWEYPWYAAWDLAFHCIALSLIDAEFAKNQLILLAREWYMHPNGQLPAYEWAFGDVNPPVHALAAYRVFQIDRKQQGGKGDYAFLERVFQKMMINFTWWVNRKDAQ
ncbi:MAG: glucosidase, partial [Gemmatimonadota bacterium]